MLVWRMKGSALRRICILLSALMLLATRMAPASAVLASPGGYGVVVDSTGRPVPGADVEVYRLDEGLVDFVQSGADGGFRFGRGSRSGALWRLRVWADGYRMGETGWVDLSLQPYQRLQVEPLLGDLQVSVRNPDGRPVAARVLVMGADGRLMSEHLLPEGELRLTGLPGRGYRLLTTAAGYVAVLTAVSVVPGRTESALVMLESSKMVVSGLIKDAVTGLPVGGRAVELLRADHTLAAMGIADQEGRFRLEPSTGEPGSYRVRVMAAGYRTLETEPMPLRAGQEQDWSGGSALALQPLTGTLAGNLLSPYGSALGNSPVILQAKGYGEIGEVKTDKDGEFRFEAVTVSPEAEFRLSSGDLNHRFSTPWLKLNVGSLTQVLLQDEPADTYTFGMGKVSGVVVTPSGAPVKGAKVELLRSAGVTKSAETGADGSFLITDVPGTWADGWGTAPYVLRVSKEEFIPTREFVLDGEPTTELHVEPRSRTIIRVVLSPAAVDILGRVTTPDGRPVRGAHVELTGEGGEALGAAVTDVQGWYRIRTVAVRPSLRYFLTVRAEGYLITSGLAVTEAVTGRGALPTVRLTPEMASVTGKVLGPAGVPLNDVAVRLYGQSGSPLAEAVSDVSGFYRLQVVPAGSGPVIVAAALEGWSTATAEVAALPARGESLSRNLILLPQTAALEGRVLDERSQPVTGVRVELLQEGRGVIGRATTDSEGRYRFEGLTSAGSGWFGLRVRTGAGRFAGSLTNGTAVAPLISLLPGERKVVDLLVRMQVLGVPD